MRFPPIMENTVCYFLSTCWAQAWQVLRDSLNIFSCHSVLNVSLNPRIKQLIRVWRLKIAPHLWRTFVRHRSRTDMCVCELLKHSSVSSALIKYIRPVFVSRSDQDSRRKTVEEIKRRAHSGGAWPQVPLQLTDTRLTQPLRLWISLEISVVVI